MKNLVFLVTLNVVIQFGCATSSTPADNAVASQAAVHAPIPPPPKADVETPYYNRQRIDVSNLRDFYDGLLVADIMIHADAMFDAKTKWKLTLYQMVRLGSNHHQVRAARQLSSMGVSMTEILPIWSPGYPESIKDVRIREAFKFVDAASKHPSGVTADTHAALRMQFIDRQIAELIELVGINVTMATHDLILPIPTDKESVAWAEKNLSSAGWRLGANEASSPEEQRKNMLFGEALDKAYKEVMTAWRPEDLTAPTPGFSSDWINYMTGYDVSRITFDGDQDGIEEPFDDYPTKYLEWKKPGRENENVPPAGTPAFDVAAYDYSFYRRAYQPGPDTKYALSDRSKFDTEWTRQSSIGTVKIDEYFNQKDRALGIAFKWSAFFVNQLASGCGHCQVHGAYGTYHAIKDDYPYDEIPDAEVSKVVKRIRSLMDFERSALFTDAEKAVYRIARDSGPLPMRTTSAHIEELRRHYSDREIQEILSLMVTTSWLATVMQAQITVTDRTSMAWAQRNLGPVGWKAGAHFGLPNEQRRFSMPEVAAFGFAEMNMGKVTDVSGEWLDTNLPLAVDTDGDGVEDGFDGFPQDPSRWEDTDRDGMEDSVDPDIDGDGIPNEDEVVNGTFPYKADSDADGMNDRAEAEAGTDPLDPRS
ncbi:MAG: hypothetical protein AAGJ56_05420 [Myxococcota bacterium]